MTGARHILLSAVVGALLAGSGLAQSPSITGTISTYAGSPFPVSGTPALTQAIDVPSSVLPDGAGGFFFSSQGQHRIYRVAADGRMTVFAGSGSRGFSGDGGPAITAQLYWPTDMALDAAGNLFIADFGNDRIRKVTAAGVITTVADQLSGPSGVVVDAAGNLFVAEVENRVRKITPAGVMNTIANVTTSNWGGDGYPPVVGMAIDAQGNLFVPSNYFNNSRVRKVSPDGQITIVAGNGSSGFSGDGGPATAAQLNFATAVALDAAGNLLIVDSGNLRIRKVNPAGLITTVVGNGTYGFSGDGGPAIAAGTKYPMGIAMDAAGTLWFADRDNYRIRKVTANGLISTVAGNGFQHFSGDGGPAISALLSEPEAVAVDATGNLFLGDKNNSRVRKITPDGLITTVAGGGSSDLGDGGPATATQLGGTNGLAVDRSGNLFIADFGHNRVRKVTPGGLITTVAGNGFAFGSGGDGGPAIAASLAPMGVATDAAGNLFITDLLNARVHKVTPDGLIRTVAGSGTQGFSGDGGPALSAQLYFPWSVAVDAAGNLFIADYWNHRIRKVTPDGLITTVAGNGTPEFSGDGGPAIAAGLPNPRGLAIDAAGNLFIASYNRIRKMTPDGRITTVAGDGTPGFSGDGGPAIAAGFSAEGVAVDPAGNLFIADGANDRVRRVMFTQQSSFSIGDLSGLSLRSSGTLASTMTGYASIRPNVSGATTPAGLAILGFRQNGVLVTETSVPASPAIQSGRMYVEVDRSMTAGLAIANPNGQAATITFLFTDSNGAFGNGTVTVPPNGQIAKFVTESPFNVRSSFNGTLTLSSSMPVAVVGVQGRINERGEFLLTTLPVFDLRAPATMDAIVFPHFADGGGWTTQIILVNPTDSALTGTVQFIDASGQASRVETYSLSPRGSQTFQTAGSETAISSGWVRVTPAINTAAPAGVALFSFRKNGITITEAGVPATPTGRAFRLYAETSESIQTGIAVANTSANSATVTVELRRLDGSSTGLSGVVTVPANGHVALFLNEVPGLGSLETPFQGVLRLSSSAPIAVAGLRERYNERNDLLITATSPVEEGIPLPSPLFLPHIADSGGYTSQFIVFSAQPGPASGTIQFLSQSGGAWNVTLH